ncbi:MAG TPA: hypothetical protein VJB90_03220 [Candidatus Nanoarchaeia archaeon]|nr:hypothetical protein [Candidatus Nanoarchaeia archaeon]
MEKSVTRMIDEALKRNEESYRRFMKHRRRADKELKEILEYN